MSSYKLHLFAENLPPHRENNCHFMCFYKFKFVQVGLLLWVKVCYWTIFLAAGYKGLCVTPYTDRCSRGRPALSKLPIVLLMWYEWQVMFLINAMWTTSSFIHLISVSYSDSYRFLMYSRESAELLSDQLKKQVQYVEKTVFFLSCR